MPIVAHAVKWEGDEEIKVLEAFVAGEYSTEEKVVAGMGMGDTLKFAPAAALQANSSVYTSVYESDFSLDPGWVTDDPNNFYWQASTSALFAKALTLPPSYQPNRYLVTETDLDPTRSFTLEADIMMLEFDRSGVLIFGLYAEDLRSSNQVGAGMPRSNGTFNVELYKLNANDRFWGNNIVDKDRQNLGGGGFTTPAHQLNTWYHVALTYDAETATASLLVTHKETGALHRTRTRTGVYFNPNMRFLGIAINPEGLDGTSMSFANDPGGSASFLLDNVALKQISENTPPALANLVQHERAELNAIGEGDTFVGNSVTLSGDIVDLGEGDVQLEVEVKPASIAFNGIGTYFSELSGSSDHSVEITSLIQPPETIPIDGIITDFHWRARAVHSSGIVSEWQEFGESGNIDFTAHYTLGLRAADLAKQLLRAVNDLQPDPADVYELGARGWDYLNGVFVSPLQIVTGYNQRNNFTRFVGIASGIDCSGLIYWAFNKSVDPQRAEGNYVANITADGMYRDEQSDPVEESELLPGDALFFNFAGGTRIDHVAMYVGESGGYDVVNAGSETLGISSELSSILSKSSAFVDFRRMHLTGFEGQIKSGSPVDLAVTDPNGDTLSYVNMISSEHELIREIPGEMYYSEIQQGHDGNPVDVVYLSTIKEGVYRVKVIPDAEAEPQDTYSLTFDAKGEVITIIDNGPVGDIPKGGFAVHISDEGNIQAYEITPSVLFEELKNIAKEMNYDQESFKQRIETGIDLAQSFYEREQKKQSILHLTNLSNFVTNRIESDVHSEDVKIMLGIIEEIRSLLDS